MAAKRKRGRPSTGQGETLYLNPQWLEVFRLAGGNEAHSEILAAFQAIAQSKYDKAIAILEELKKPMEFSYEELVFMVDALNGVGCSPSTLAGNIEGATPYIGAKHPDVDATALVHKLEAMPLIKVAEIHAAIAEFWSAGSVSDIRQRLIQVGLLAH